MIRYRSPIIRYRSAITGYYVKRSYALDHPKTTVREEIKGFVRSTPQKKRTRKARLSGRLRRNRKIINRERRARMLPLIR